MAPSRMNDLERRTLGFTPSIGIEPENRIMKRRILLRAAAAGSFAPLVLGHSAWAAKKGTLRVVVPYAPGGPSDRIARIVSEELQRELGRNVVVENKPGGGGRVAAQQVKRVRANQDDTLLLGNPAVMVVGPLVFDDVGYDPENDFQAVSEVGAYDLAIAVGPEVEAQTLPDLLDWLKANPQQANVGVPSTGSLVHFFALMVGDAADTEVEVIGYKGAGPLITDLIGGQLPVAIDAVDALLPQHEAGKLRMLATSGEQRSRFLPELPTFKEVGLDVAITGWNAFFAPASMAAETVAEVSEAIQKVMASEATQERVISANMEPVISDMAQTAHMLRNYRAELEPVVKRSGYKP